MENMELARACAKTKCQKCNPALKQECLKNACWQNAYPKDNATPAVYYGVLPAVMSRECLDEAIAWRDKWFADRPNLQKPELPAWMKRLQTE